MKKYSVLILGELVDNWNLCMSSAHMLTLGIYEAFNKIPDIDVKVMPVINNYDLPKVDVLLYIHYAKIRGYRVDLRKFKNRSQCKVAASFLENPIIPHTDLCFVCNKRYMGKTEKYHYISYPYNSDLLIKSKCENKFILIDHMWERYLRSDWDWTHRISHWLGDVSNEYKIHRFIRNQLALNSVKDYETVIEHSGYVDYLDNTKDISIYIPTHHEGYGFGIVDMIARGVKVISPPRLLQDFFIDDFKIPIFQNKEELLKLLSKNIVHNTSILTSFDKVAEKMDIQFQRKLKI